MPPVSPAPTPWPRPPDYVNAHMNKGHTLSSLADLHLTLGDPARAQAAWLDAIAATDEALRRAPDHVMALGNQGEILRKLADLHHQQGDTSAACKRLREAETLLDRALALAPNNAAITAEHARVKDRLRSHCPPS
jgi:tetratricopeptide (TPR) repeat protein